METGEKKRASARLRLLDPRDGAGRGSLRRRVSALRRQRQFSLFRALLAAAITGFFALAAYQRAQERAGHALTRSDLSEGLIGFALAAGAILLWRLLKTLKAKRRRESRRVSGISGGPDDFDD